MYPKASKSRVLALMLAAGGAAALLPAGGCESKTENAVEEVEDAVEDTADEIEDALDD